MGVAWRHFPQYSREALNESYWSVGRCPGCEGVGRDRVARGGQLGGAGLFERDCMVAILLREGDVVQPGEACLVEFRDGRSADPQEAPFPRRFCREKSTRVSE